MYQKIMIPLDGSKLAEDVLPHAEAFIRNGNVKKAILIRVLKPPIRYYYEVGIALRNVRDEDIPRQVELYKEMEAQERRDALEYLKQIAARFSRYGTEIECQVMRGYAAQMLAQYAKENGVDLILTATHGLSGIRGHLKGSISNQVMRFSHMPVLMVNAAA